MTKIKVQDNQTIFDIALQYNGSVDSVMDILLHNGKLNDVLLIDEIIEIPYVVNKAIVDYFEGLKHVIVTSGDALDSGGYVPVINPKLVKLTVNGSAYIDLFAPDVFNVKIVDNNDDLVDLTIESGVLKIPALPCSGPANPAIVNIFQSDSTLLHTFEVPSGDVENWKIADSEITVGGHSWGVKSEDDLDVLIVDSDDNSVATSRSGNKLVVDGLPSVQTKTLELIIPYSNGDASVSITVVTDSGGTITTADTTGLRGVKYTVNGTAETLPITLVATDVVVVSFDAPDIDGIIKLTLIVF